MVQELLLVGALLLGLYCLLCVTVLKLPRCKSTVKLHGKTAIVTGANTGIGKTTAMDLARRGARVILACRDRGRAEAAIQEIVQETGNNQVIFMQLDLASLRSIRSFADDFLRAEPRLDLLINNAGLVNSGKTEDGFGMIFGVNHLGHFLLTVLLLDRLKASGPSRVVTVASTAYTFGKLDFNCLTTHRDLVLGSSDFTLFQSYSCSKLCNVLFTHELAKKLQGSTVTCYSLHPGQDTQHSTSHGPQKVVGRTSVCCRGQVRGCCLYGADEPRPHSISGVIDSDPDPQPCREKSGADGPESWLWSY
ncbi:hypothetical protein INR49_031447 [Caranx melampygus]|nr:hypothetical protein INR49_031447 [Caranx melampygus]